MRNLKLGSTAKLVDGNYTVCDAAGGNVRLRNEDTLEYRVVHVTELALLLAEPPERDTVGAAELARLEDINGDGAIIEMEAHILEVLEGRPLRGASRPEYDLATTSLTGRITTKARELSNASKAKPISTRTLERKIENYRRSGPAGLIDRRSQKKTKPLGQADPRLVDALVAVIGRETNESTGTADRLIVRLKTELAKRHPGEDVSVPSKNTLTRYVNLLSKGKYTLGDAQNRRTAANAPNRMFGSRPAFMPGAEVQIDSSPFDIVALGSDGNPIRVILTIMIDKATRSIISTGVSPVAAKGIDHALMLARCFVPHTLRPVPGFEEIDPPTMPWAAFLTAEKAAELDTLRPFIVPQRIMTDNGADFLASVFRSACAYLGVSITEASIHTPTDKAIVERAFHTIKTQFAQHLPGFTGGSVGRRGEALEKTPGLLDIFTLQTLFERWVTIVYQNTKTEGLRDPYDPTIELTPNAAYLSMFELAGGFVEVPLLAEDYIRLLPIQPRKILRDGIQIGRRRYDSPLLGPFRELSSPTGRGTRNWDIREDPYNPSAVWVEDPDTGEWIQCDWMNDDAFIKPFSRTTRRIAAELQNSIIGMTQEEARTITQKVIASTPAAKAQETAAAKRREMVADLREQQGIVMPTTTGPSTASARIDDDEEEDDDYEVFEAFDTRKATR